jgi:hypothetical protein
MLKKLDSVPMDKVTGVSLSLMLGKPKHAKKEHHDEEHEEHAPESGLEEGITELLENWTERDKDTLAGEYYHDLKRLADSHGIKVDGDDEDSEEKDNPHNSDEEESY